MEAPALTATPSPGAPPTPVHPFSTFVALVHVLEGCHQAADLMIGLLQESCEYLGLAREEAVTS